jgi:hypothetical protein
MRESQKVVIGGDDRPGKLGSPCKVVLIRRSQEPFVGCRQDIDLPAAKTGDDSLVDTLVRVELERHAWCRMLASGGTAGVFSLELGDQGAGFLPLPVDRILMVVVVAQRGVHVRETQVGMGFHDLIGSHASVLMLAGDLANLDVGSGDDRSRAEVVDVREMTARGFHVARQG